MTARPRKIPKFLIPIIFINICLLLTGCATFFPEPQKPLEPPARAETPRVLHIGMEMNQVLGIWGEPWDVQVAGEPSRGNQKWSYFTGVRDRFDSAPARVVYFESGQVVGWDTSSN